MRGRCGSSCSKLHFLMWYGLMSTSEHMVQGTSNHGKGKTEHNPTHRVASAEGAWLVCGCVASRRQRPGLLQISLRHDFQWCSRPGGGKAILPSALSCKSSSDRCLSMYCGCLCVTPASTCKLEQPQLKLQSWCSTLRMTATRDWWKTWREGPRSLQLCARPSASVWRCAPGWSCSYPSLVSLRNYAVLIDIRITIPQAAQHSAQPDVT